MNQSLSVTAAAVRTQVDVPLRFADGYATTARVFTFDGLGDGKGPNPLYTEAYGQLDVNVSYQVNDNLSVSVEGINLTNETMRVHGRNERQLYTLDQFGPRYMFGVRYKF